MAKAIAQITIRDENDITIGSVAPTNPVKDQMWLDTSSSPSVMKRWTGSAWEIVNDVSDELEDLKETTKSQSTTISVMQGQIVTAIQNTQIVKNGQNVLLKDEYSKLEQTVSGINSTVGSHTTKITAAENKITTVEGKQTTLEQNLNGFKTTVSTTYGTKQEVSTVDGKVTSLTTRMSTAESSITQLESEIELKVEATDVTNAIAPVDGKITSLTNQVSQINIDISSITQRVSTTETNNTKLTNQLDQSKQNTRCNDLGVKINYSAFATSNAGELYLHGYDTNNNPTDTNGKIYWNGTTLNVIKGMIDPNSNVPLNTDVFLFVNKTTSSTIVYGTYYHTTNKTWSYVTLIGGSGTSHNWTPGKDHIAIGQFSMLTAESFNYAYLYETPQSLVSITIGPMNLLSRVNSAELKITDSAIIGTVTKTITDKVSAAVDEIQVGGRNLIIRATETPDTYIDTAGAIVTQANHATTDYIEVTVNESIMFSKKVSTLITDGFFRWAWYDSSKTYINRQADATNVFKWVVPTNAAYIRVSYPIDSYPKVERGNKATDWTPSPEDVDATLKETETILNDNIDTAVGDVKDEVLKDVKNNYTSNGEFSSFSKTVNSKFEQTATDITSTFDTVNKYTKEVDGKLQTFQNTVSTHIRFNENGMEIGKTNSPFTSKLDNEKMAFCQDGAEVAYISNNKMVITTADIDDQLRIGDKTNGFFVWTQGSSGNLTLKWSEG